MAFDKKLTLNGNPSLIPQIAQRIREVFQADGYDVVVQELYNGGVDVSLTKGGVFKAILGMKTALKVTMLTQGDLISFEESVGIFGQQAIPTIIMLFVAWPVAITQIWGLVKQSQLDDNVLAVANQVILENQAGGACPPPPPFNEPAAFNEPVIVNDSVAPVTEVTVESFVAEPVIPEPVKPEPGVRFCTECGAKVPAEARFCPSCGHKL